jgi:hypothetical protein
VAYGRVPVLRTTRNRGRRAIPTGRRPPAACADFPILFCWSPFGFSADTKMPCHDRAERLAGQRFCLPVPDDAVSVHSIRPHRGHTYGTLKPPPGRSITGFRCETAAR